MGTRRPGPQLTLFACLLLAACAKSKPMPLSDLGIDAVITDAGPADIGRDAPMRDAQPDDGVPQISCGGTPCATGQECCFETGLCFAAMDRDTACPAPPRADGGTLPPCASNADCGPMETCVSDVASFARCLGAGECVPRGLPADCAASSATPVCGCDGVTYRNPCAATAYGVRIATQAACGEGTPDDPGPVGCGMGGACSGGTTCCHYWGRCLPSDCADCCRPAPPGTSFPCRLDEDCPGTGSFCDGPGCGPGGGCVYRDCSLPITVFEPVCGCDGRTYVNWCAARVAGVRKFADGMCAADAGVP